MKKYLVIAITVFVLTLSTVSAQAVASVKSQVQLTKKIQPLMGITKGDNIDKAAEEIQKFNSDISLRKLSGGYRGSLYVYGEEFTITLMPNEDTKEIRLIGITSPKYDLHAESISTVTLYTYNLFRTALILFMGDPSDEFLAIDGKDSNTKYMAAFPYHGYLPVDDLINANGEAFLCSSWNKEYNIQLVCDNKEETIQITLFIQYY